MEDNRISELMDVTMTRIKELVDSNTIIGDAITTPDGTMILPVSKVNFGFASGGSDFPSKTPQDLFGGGSGAGVSIHPVGFLVIKNGDVKLLQLSDPAKTTADRLVNAMPDVIDKIQGFVAKPDKKQE